MSPATLAALDIVVGVPLAGVRSGLAQIRGMVASTASAIRSTLTTAIGVAGGNLLADSVRKMREQLEGAVQEGIAFNAQMETMQVGFENMLKSAAKARRLIADIKEFAKTTPFSLEDTSKLAAQLLTTRQITEEQLIPTMRKLGDAAAGSVKGFESLPGISLAITQMLMKGKIAAEEMSKQLVNAGIPAWDILSQKTGKTTKELMELAKKGKLGINAVKLLIDGMGERFQGLMEKQSRTWTGLWERFRDTARQALGEITGPLFERLKRMMEKINEFINSSEFRRGVHQLKMLVESIVSTVEKAIPVIIDGIRKAVREVQFFMENWRMVFDYIMLKAAETASYLYDQFKYTLNERLPFSIVALWDGMVAGAQEASKHIVQIFMAAIRLIGDMMKTMFKSQVERFRGLRKALEAVQRGKLGDAVEELAKGEMKAAAVGATGTQAALSNFTKSMAPVAKSVGDAVSKAMGDVMKAMPAFKESPLTKTLRGAADRMLGNIKQARKEFEGRENARQKLKSAVDFIFGNAMKGIGFVSKLFGGKAGDLAGGPLIDEVKKDRKPKVVGLTEMNRHIQEELTDKEAKDRKEMLKAVKENKKAAEKGNVIGQKIADGVNLVGGLIKKLNPGFAE